MKETKVYVDELPKNCFECLFMTDNQEGYDGCFCKLLDERAETKNRLKNCPLIDIKDHDRELVKEVLEKVKNEAYDEGFVDEYGDRFVTYHINNFLLNKIQKEYEK